MKPGAERPEAMLPAMRLELLCLNRCVQLVLYIQHQCSR